MDTSPDYPSTFDGLLQLVGHLRGPAGCPWDREQTSESMKPNILEECYELLEAIDEGDAGKKLEELGDVMFHLAFQVQLGKEEGAFDEEQVFGAVNKKLTGRHPHVFGDATASDAREVESGWHDIKRRERGDAKVSVLDGVPQELPALSRAEALQERAARSGFDWEDAEGVVEKVREELDELQAARSPAELEAELGDILFSIVNLARWLGVDAEGALRRTDARFRRRFSLMEKMSRERGVTFDGLALPDKEKLWQEAKSLATDSPRSALASL